MWFAGMPTATIEYEDVVSNSSVLPAFAGPSGGDARYYTWVNAIMAYTQAGRSGRLPRVHQILD